MNTSPNSGIRGLCTVGRLLAIVGLVVAALAMLRVISDPSRMNTWTASLVLGVVFIAFLTDRFLSTVMDRLDRFGEPAGLEDRNAGDLRDAA